MTSDELQIIVVGGMANIYFQPGCSTGVDPDTRPGVSFRLQSERQAFSMRGGFHHGMGVIGRRDARLLYEMLGRFLSDADRKT